MRELIEKAARRRLPFPDEETNAFRLLDGEGDGLPGVEIDELAGHWLVSTRDTAVGAELAGALHVTGRSVYH